MKPLELIFVLLGSWLGTISSSYPDFQILIALAATYCFGQAILRSGLLKTNH